MMNRWLGEVEVTLSRREVSMERSERRDGEGATNNAQKQWVVRETAQVKAF